MKIKYNFGLLKQLDIGFSSEDKTKRFHDVLLDVKKIKNKYKFIYKNQMFGLKIFNQTKFKIGLSAYCNPLFSVLFEAKGNLE